MWSFLKGLKRKVVFDDNSSIEWCDRETIKYIENEKFCLVWVDYYEKNFFSAIRLIHTDSIKQWQLKDGTCQLLTNEQRKEIAEKIIGYYEKRGIKVKCQ